MEREDTPIAIGNKKFHHWQNGQKRKQQKVSKRNSDIELVRGQPGQELISTRKNNHEQG